MILLERNILLEFSINEDLVEFFRKTSCISSESSLYYTYGPPLTVSRFRSQFILLTSYSPSKHIITISLDSRYEIFWFNKKSLTEKKRILRESPWGRRETEALVKILIFNLLCAFRGPWSETIKSKFLAHFDVL